MVRCPSCHKTSGVLCDTPGDIHFGHWSRSCWPALSFPVSCSCAERCPSAGCTDTSQRSAGSPPPPAAFAMLPSCSHQPRGYVPRLSAMTQRRVVSTLTQSQPHVFLVSSTSWPQGCVRSPSTLPPTRPAPASPPRSPLPRPAPPSKCLCWALG